MSLARRLRVMADRWEEWAADLGAEAAAAVRECVADLRGELRTVTERKNGRKATSSKHGEQ